ncbi:MFS transporter [Ottowia sp.]|uniref:MFS transporter n=1 Tax=Ottowia sp. TaxID=1898956 RepID=UPI002BC98907|nr:MFS transporter [Ottowia sp.]HOB68010.1 MFS transporter [Ottowia sp.]HPZ55903.1 MFS transporter [Ottowia sp.]HQD49293.1 MFS transporter [Ottowia sp.]
MADAAAGAQTPAPPSGWWSLAVTTAIQAMVSMALLTLPAMAPTVARGLGVPAALVGGYVALCYLAAMLSSLAGGTLVRRWGAIRVSQLGLSLCAVGLLVCALPWWPAAALGALFIGAGYGPITPASSHLLALTTPAHRMALVFSVKQTGVPAGGMLAGALVPGLSLWIGWQGALAVVAAVCAVCAVASQPLRAPLDADRQRGQPLALGALLKPVGMVLGHRSLAVLAACSFLFSAVQVSVTAYMVTYLHQSLGMTLLAAGAALSVSQLAGVVGRIAWGAVADRGWGPRNTLMLLAALMMVGSVLTALLQPGWPTGLVWAVVALLGASAIGWNGVYLATVARQAPPGQASAATGGTLTFTFMGVVCGSPAFGALAGASGSYRLAFAALAVPAALALGLLTWRALQAAREARAAG